VFVWCDPKSPPANQASASFSNVTRSLFFAARRRPPRARVTIHLGDSSANFCAALLERALRPDALPLARAAGDEAALRALAQSLMARFQADPLFSQGPAQLEGHIAALAARVAATGLRLCALPACGAVEPHPRAWRVCGGRCAAAAAYCCVEHSVTDWKRHKRADGCGRKDASGAA
jgi:hypothetical protein